MSTTTTLAPSSAICRAMARPTPRPAPVTIATFPDTIPGIVFRSPIAFPGGPRPTGPTLFPHLGGQLHDHRQLRPLLVLGQGVALLGRGEAALAGNAELVKR